MTDQALFSAEDDGEYPIKVKAHVSLIPEKLEQGGVRLVKNGVPIGANITWDSNAGVLEIAPHNVLDAGELSVIFEPEITEDHGLLEGPLVLAMGIEVM